MKKKMLKILKTNERPITQNFKVNREEKLKIEHNANLYAKANISAWLRYAAINYIPKESELC